MIGNHNAVTYMPDTWVTALAIVDRRGTERPAYSLPTTCLLAFPVVGPFLRRIGAIPAGSHDAETALAEDALVLDYPGGDWEACRPWTERNTIDFGGRTGFVRLALRTGVPLVPVVAHGSHDSLVVLSRGERIARTLGLSGLHIKVFPDPARTARHHHGAAPATAAALLGHGGVPACDVLDDLGPDAADDPETVARCAGEVTGAMQAALDRCTPSGPTPSCGVSPVWPPGPSDADRRGRARGVSPWTRRPSLPGDVTPAAAGCSATGPPPGATVIPTPDAGSGRPASR